MLATLSWLSMPPPATPQSLTATVPFPVMLRFHSRFCRCHHLPFQPSLAPTGAHFLCNHTKYDVTDAMVMDDARDTRFKASKDHIEDRLQELLREFRRSRSKKYDHVQDTGYPRKREEFPRWEDGDPIDGISHAESFFIFTRLRRNPWWR
ncbi:hypothetical protein B296_00030894 [Ensete ventricosum]|uniref:Uncharacterized protein n=1 Tax=Ensete ventricosum TaxID=4639 RepID=A0A426ZID3_ENSVE|nr:hypothetical protein B296_00030894 [Ensete ventricosum]